MPALDFESDQFLQLLTDALRAGPGSPEWHEAVESLRSNGSAEVDEYRMLISARENLEKGKEYRSVRAGPGFSRRLNHAIDEQGLAARRPPATTAGAVAIISAGLILTAVAVLLYLLFPGGATNAASEKLANTYFVEPLLAANFDSSIPAELTRIGALELEAQRGLRPVAGSSGGALRGGGVVWTQTVAAEQPIAIDAALRVTGPADDLIAEIFVTDEPAFSDDRGTSRHELLWLYQAGQSLVVLPGEIVEKQTAPNREFKGTINVRVALDRDSVIVSQQGKPIWSGAHRLDASKPRSIGLRFIKVGAGKTAEPAIAFGSIKVMKP